ncbi:transposable element Tc1 transposase [Trichonephila clavipes]|nr:transposable element Tc1 transposase [Trichonephila clavipes]
MGELFFQDISERLGQIVSTEKDCWKKWSRNGSASRRSDSENPRGKTESEDHRIRHTTGKNCTASAAEIRGAVDITVAQRTVRNQLFQGQLQATHPVACIPLLPSYRNL